MDSIVFNSICWEERDEIIRNNDETNNYELKFVIEIFGRTKDEKTVYTKVTNFCPFFYIEIDEDMCEKEINGLVREIKNKLPKKNRESLIKHEIVKKCKFVEFNNYAEFTFVRLMFSNYFGMKKCSEMLSKQISIPQYKINSKIFNRYESNIYPYLRCMHLRELTSTGWIKIDKYEKLANNISCCDINITTDWINLHKHVDENLSKIKILSYDIECTSEDGNFPQKKRDPILMIGSSISKYGEKDCYYKSIITLGTCDKIDGIDVKCCDTEEEVLLEWCKLVRKNDPDIVMTFNGFGFDNEYMYVRAKQLGIDKKFMKLSRITEQTCRYIEQKLTSSAMGENVLKYFSFDGRIQIDVFKLIQQIAKLDSYKLDSVASVYIKESINDIINKNTIITKNTYGLVKNKYISIHYNDGLSDNKYGRIDKFLVKKVTDTSIVIDGAIDKNELDFKNCKIYWSQAKDDVTPNDIFKSYHGTSTQRATIAKYCVQDCELLNVLVNKLNAINNYVGMANVCHVPLSFIFMRGQGIKIFSLVAEKCRKRNHLIPVLCDTDDEKVIDFDNIGTNDASTMIEKIIKYVNKDNNLVIFTDKTNLIKTGHNIDIYCNKKTKKEHDKINEDPIKILKCNKKSFKLETTIEFDMENYNYFWVYKNDSYEGATVFEPKIGIHKEPTPVLDFKSLYPTIMISYNMSNETLIKKMEKTKDCDEFKVNAKMGANKMVLIKFIKKNNIIGILPEILIDLLKARSDTRKMIDKTDDLFLKAIYDGLQLAYKIIANSLYGQTGAKTSYIRKIEIAAATTAAGRDMLLFAKDFVEIKTLLIAESLLEKKHRYNNFKKAMLDILNPCNKNRLETIFFNLVKKDNNVQNKAISINNESDIMIMKDIFIKDVYEKIKDILNDFTITIKPEVIYGDTDSVFFCPHFIDIETKKILYDKPFVEKAILLGKLLDKITFLILKEPMELEYEKTFWPLCLLKKKKYVGNLYESDPNKFYQKSMGIVLKRRDNAPIVKIVCGGIVRELLNNSAKSAVDYTINILNDIVCKKIKIDKFIITKTLKETYKDRSKIAHAVLADRIEMRTKNKIASNTRIEYVYTVPNKKTKLQGDRIEDPDYVIEHNLDIDTLFYITNQLANPVCQFLDFCIENPKKIIDHFVVNERNKQKGKRNILSFSQ